MLFNTLITSIRFLAKSKTYTAINLCGLVLGLTASFILFVFIINERSFNRDYDNKDRIFRVLTLDKNQEKKDGMTPFRLAADLKKFHPQIEQTARIINIESCIGTVEIQKGNYFQAVPGFICADPSLLDMLGVNIMEVDRKFTLRDNHSVLISARVAKKIFGSSASTGKLCKVRINGKIYSLKVAGIFQDLPWNSTVQAGFMAGIGFYKELLSEISRDPEIILQTYQETSNETYILLGRKAGISEIISQMDAFYRQSGIGNHGLSYAFQPFPDIYLHSSDIQNDFNPKGNRSNTLVYSLLAGFILFLAGMNYSILSTARSALRYKEIGIRKVFGATRTQLRLQIIIESVLLTFIAFPLSFLLLGLIDPFLEKLYGYSIVMYASNFLTYTSIFAGITILIGLLSGLYVAVYLASLDPLFALKMKLFAYKRFTLSKIFIVFQLFITLSLLIGFITIDRQIIFCLNRDLGLNKENLLVIHFNPGEFTGYTQLKHIARQHPDVLSVTGSSVTPPTLAASAIQLNIAGIPGNPISLERYFVDYDFFKTLGIKISSGHTFNPTDSNRNETKMLLNTEAVCALGLTAPLSKIIGPYQVIGVADNFNIRTQYQKILPAMFCFMPSACQNIMIRYKTGSPDQLITTLEKSWQQLAPKIPFSYTFFDSEVDALYKKEKNFGRVVASFTILAFIITGMGLFGLALLITERRRKEISIRKIYGASDTHIIIRIQKEFYYYIGIATGFSFPVTWYFMNKWLDTFYYHIGLNAFIFIIALFSVCLFVSLILLNRTLKVLREKPIDVLKYE